MVTLTLTTDIEALLQDTLGDKPPKIEKALEKGAELVKQTAQIKYAPVRTGALVDSFTIDKAVISSIDYIMRDGSRRYDYKGSKFVSDTGVDNSTRYQWFDRAYQEVKGDIENIIKGAM